MNFVFALYGRMEINSVLPLRRAQQSDVSVYFRALGSAQNKHGARHKMSVVYRVVFLKQIPDSPCDPLVSVENRGGGKHFFKQPAFETVMRTSEHYVGKFPVGDVPFYVEVISSSGAPYSIKSARSGKTTVFASSPYSLLLCKRFSPVTSVQSTAVLPPFSPAGL